MGACLSCLGLSGHPSQDVSLTLPPHLESLVISCSDIRARLTRQTHYWTTPKRYIMAALEAETLRSRMRRR